MENLESFQNAVENLDRAGFDTLALEIFQFQAHSNAIYGRYLHERGVDPHSVKTVDNIPYLPITFFKQHDIVSSDWTPEIIYRSSGTTGTTSRHLIRDQSFYHRHAQRIYSAHFPPPEDVLTVALLPGYLEREDASLVSMVHHFVRQGKAGSGFYLDATDQLIDILTHRETDAVLWGVTFALLELAKREINLEGVTVIETGGMKGRGKELTREELYDLLRKGLHLEDIYSEYGMTELQSQCYATNGVYAFSPTMQVRIRDINDPFSCMKDGKIGGINVIDLANFHSCAFIETMDLGKITAPGHFQALGRFDNSDLRGCNLLLNF